MTRSAGGGKLAFLADDGTLVEILLVLGWLDGVAEEIKGFAGIDDGTPVQLGLKIWPATQIWPRQYGRPYVPTYHYCRRQYCRPYSNIAGHICGEL